MPFTKNQPTLFNVEQSSWKQYNIRIKKAVEQDSSLPAGLAGWAELLICLSIAFFIVTTSALALNFINVSLASS